MAPPATARLRLRRLTLDDAPFILELVNDPDFLRFIGDKGVRTLEHPGASSAAAEAPPLRPRVQRV
jgi:RimJ/RimL family protein N-acetyltransferase